ncbi:hypothetical protein M3Y94_00097800 [Aphelenchoides besseyi]|nr:hypothetical protein M3Y94_00097800 [Aphelenchoides besseyi]KAI6237631.1 hypothetical protein M3Y95_00285800 [Aphelenchoides besseyi]
MITLDTTILEIMPMNKDVEVGATGLTERRIFQILDKIPAYHKAKDNSQVSSLDAELISPGKGFLSQVFKIVVAFDDQANSTYTFILKLPIVAGLQQVIEKGKVDGEENVVDQIVVDGHNNEVEFYKLANRISGLPVAETYAYEKIVPGRSNGLLAMEDLTNVGEPLGFYRSASLEQTLSVAREIAKLQSWAQNKEFENWYNKLRVTIHIEEIITKYTSQESMDELQSSVPEVFAHLPKLSVLFDQAFSYYCLIDKPKEYNALTFCHGDTQPNNIIFRYNQHGELTSEVAAIIDWQLVFCGNALFDLARFLTFSVDGEIREKTDAEAFRCYYNQLSKLYKKAGKKVPFTFNQGVELFELALCQQLSFLLTFLGIFVMAAKQAGQEVPNNFQILVDRALFCIRKVAHVIEKRNLKRFNTHSNL